MDASAWIWLVVVTAFKSLVLLAALLILSLIHI